MNLSKRFMVMVDQFRGFPLRPRGFRADKGWHDRMRGTISRWTNFPRAGTAHRVLLIKPRFDDDEISVGIDFNYSRDEVLAAHLL